MDAFKVLVRDYPDSRYAADALAKIEICRGRLAQKELWVAATISNQGNPCAARQRLEGVIKEYPRTLVIPEALFRLGEVYAREGRDRGVAARCSAGWPTSTPTPNGAVAPRQRLQTATR